MPHAVRRPLKAFWSSPHAAVLLEYYRLIVLAVWGGGACRIIIHQQRQVYIWIATSILKCPHKSTDGTREIKKFSLGAE